MPTRAAAPSSLATRGVQFTSRAPTTTSPRSSTDWYRPLARGTSPTFLWMTRPRVTKTWRSNPNRGTSSRQSGRRAKIRPAVAWMMSRACGRPASRKRLPRWARRRPDPHCGPPAPRASPAPGIFVGTIGGHTPESRDAQVFRIARVDQSGYGRRLRFPGPPHIPCTSLAAGDTIVVRDVTGGVPRVSS